MANALVDLIKAGDRDALNAYLLNQQIGGDSSGVSLNGQPNNALTMLVRGQSLQPQPQPQIPQQAQPQPPVQSTTINVPSGPRNLGFTGDEGQAFNQQSSRPIDTSRPMITNQSLGYGQQGVPMQNIGVLSGYIEKGTGDLIAQKDGGWTRYSAAQVKNYQDQLAEAQRQKEFQQRYQAAMLGQAEGKARQELSGTQKPVFNADAGGYVYPPSPENPQGKFVPVAGMPAGAGKPPTEDQAKAAGWFNQAQNSYKNMIDSMTDPITGQVNYKAASPSALEGILPAGMKGAVQSPERQRFSQASSSLSEALLRAATGAGVNKDEAVQKISELTPNFWDDETTKKQKLDAIPMYLESLKARAGRAQLISPEIPKVQLPSKSGGNSVTAPDGSVHNFPNAAAADAFRKAIGM